MNKISIESITVSGFRGLPIESTLTLNGKSLVLFGENGTGKSSFADAIEKYFVGDLTHFDFQNAKKGIPNIYNRDSGKYIIINFLFNGKKYPINIESIEDFPDPIHNYILNAKGGNFLLRRCQLLDFIDSSPSDRYMSFLPFLHIDRYNIFEDRFKSFTNKVVENQFESAYNDFQKKLIELTTEFNTKDVSLRALFEIINKELDSLSLPIISSVDDLDVTEQLVKDKIDLNVSQQSLQYRSLDESINELNDIFFKEEHLETFLKLYSDFQTEKKKLDSLFNLNLLIYGKEIIENEDNEMLIICPLCESEIDKYKTLERIKERLSSQQDYTTKREEYYKIAEKTVDYSRNILIEVNKIADLLSKLSIDFSLNTELISIRELMISLTKIKDIDLICPVEYIEKVKSIDVSRLLSYLKDEIAKYEPKKSDFYDKYFSIKNKLTALKRYDSYELAKRMYDKNDKIKQNCIRISKIIEESRKMYIDRVYGAIQERTEEIYRTLHNDEDVHLNFILSLDMGKKSSCSLKLSHEKEEYDVRSIFSEGHLDSLALAFFFALRELEYKSNPDFNLIVLDDIITSLDAQHRSRLADFIIETYINDYQIIITTHDKIWFDQLREHTKGGHENKIEFNEIRKYDTACGPTLNKAITDIDYIKNQDNDLDSRCSKAAGYLENFLYRLCQNIRVTMKLNPGFTFSLKDLWDNFKKRMDDYPNYKSSKLEIIQNLDKQGYLRNPLAHGKDYWKMLDSREKEDFISSIVNFTECLKCKEDNCKSTFIKVDDNDHLCCIKGHKLDNRK